MDTPGDTVQDEPLAEGAEKRRLRFLSRFLPRRLPRRTLWRIALGLVGGVAGLVVLYYLVGMLWVHKIDADAGFEPGEVPPGASRAVAVAAALIEREVDRNGWVANDPFFLPGSLLDNMPNFQQGIVSAIGRFTIELLDQIGRTRGTSQADPDLDKAAGLLKYPGDIWIFDLSTSWAPTASSEAQYRAARRALLSYNRRLAEGRATFERRADNLLTTLDRIATDLGSASAVLDQHLEENAGGIIDLHADDIFYNVKGRLYAYALIFRELGRDFQNVLAERDLESVWAQTLDSLQHAAGLQPWVVLNGRPDSEFVPSHLAAQGFFLLRARTQLREITNILQK